MRVVRFRADREPPRFGLVREGSLDVLELPGETFLEALGSVSSPGRAVY